MASHGKDLMLADVRNLGWRKSWRATVFKVLFRKNPVPMSLSNELSVIKTANHILKLCIIFCNVINCDEAFDYGME
jgi:hypothetical protein